MNRLKRPDNRLYFGVGGSGKSTLALHQARAYKRVLYVRPTDDERPPFPEAHDRAALIRAMMLPEFRLAYCTNMQLEEYEWANEAALAARDTLVIWEEAGMLTPRALKQNAPKAFQLWMAGRHSGCRVFACSQRPASCSPDLRANLSRAMIFRTIEPLDLDYYRALIGRSLIDTVQSLNFDARECLDWTLSGHSVRQAPFD